MTMVAPRDEGLARSAQARRAMIDSQLRVSGVNEDFVLAAMNRVPREDFVPDAMRGVAYVDRAVPLGNGRFLAAPLVHGRMLAEASPKPEDKVLVVDGGSGYLAELVRTIAADVDVVDAASAAAGSRKKGDYSLLLIDGAVEQIPASLAGLLSDGARVVTGLVSRGVIRLAVGRKVSGNVSLLPLAEMGIPVLPEFAVEKRWAFQ